MPKHYLTTFIKLLVCTLLFLSSNIGYASVTPTPDPATTQQQLNLHAGQLSAITNALTQPVLSDGTLEMMQEQSEGVMTRTQQLQHLSQEKTDDYTTLISVLGPAPKAGEHGEDPVTATKRQQLNAQLALYNAQTQQAKALIAQSISLSNMLAQRRLQNKAKGLLQHNVPLYDPIIWKKGFTQSDDAMLKAWDNTLIMFKKSVQALQAQATTTTFIITSFCISFFGFIVGWIGWHHFGRRYITAKPSLVRKLITTITNIFTLGILPLITVLLIIFVAKQYEIIYQAQWYILTNFFLMLSAITISILLIKQIIAPALPNWRILQLRDESAHLLARQLHIFTTLAILNWFITTIGESIPLDFLIPCEFLLRVTVCISGLVLLKKRYWLNEKLTQQPKNTPRTTRSAQIIFIHYLRVASIIVFITNPIFMLLGYIVLANFLFISFIQTVAIVAVLLGLHIVCYQIFSQDLLLNNHATEEYKPNLIDDTFTLSDRSREILQYWLIVTCDIIFFCIGTIAIVLAWGLDSKDLWRFIKPIFTGFTVGHYHFSLTKLFVAIAAFFILMTITRLLQRFLNRHVFPYTNIDAGVQNTLYQGIGYIGITISILVSIGMIGINLTNLALIAGALSVGIGFGLQNIVSNFIAGIIVLVERPIKIGDRIMVGQDEGTVKRINVRATEIEPGDGSSVLIPNSELIAGRVRNWTFRNPLTKVDIPVAVAFGSDTRLVEKSLLDVAAKNADVAKDPAPSVTFANFGTTALEFKLSVAVYNFSKRASTSSELRYAIEQSFKENNIKLTSGILPGSYPNYPALQIKQRSDFPG